MAVVIQVIAEPIYKCLDVWPLGHGLACLTADKMLGDKVVQTAVQVQKGPQCLAQHDVHIAPLQSDLLAEGKIQDLYKCV